MATRQQRKKEPKIVDTSYLLPWLPKPSQRQGLKLKDKLAEAFLEPIWFEVMEVKELYWKLKGHPIEYIVHQRPACEL